MVTLKTITGGTLTATEHAMLNWSGFPHDVIISPSANIQVNGNTIAINDDIYGILAGRLYRIADESFTFSFPVSGSLVGVLYLRLDLNNIDNPFQLLASTGTNVSDLVQEQNTVDSGISNFENENVVIKWLCSFTITATEITDLTLLIPYGDDAKAVEKEIDALDTRMDGILASVINAIYPVGAIYMSVSATNPGTLFTGTSWLQIKDTFLLAAGDSYAGGSTGGEARHTLTASEMPSHTHTFTGTAASHTHTFTGTAATSASGGAHAHKPDTPRADFVPIGTGMTVPSLDSSGHHSYTGYITANDGAHAHSFTAKGTNANTSITPAGRNSNTGGGGAHNNMPPYQAVYVWRRIA
jgi:microcystin-dependent protein